MSNSTFIDSVIERITNPERISVGFRTAARLTGLGESTLRRYAADGLLYTTKVRQRRLIPIHELERLVTSGDPK